MRGNLRHLILTGASFALLSGTHAAHADTILHGMLYVDDYGKSVMERYQYTYDLTTNVMTGITPYGIGGNLTNAYFLGDASTMPIKEGVQGTANDMIVVVGNHGSTNTTLQRYTLDGTYIGNVPVNFAQFGNNVGIGNVAITPDGRYEYAPLETANKVIKIDLLNGAIVDSFTLNGAHDVAIAANGDVYAANYANGTPKIVRLDSNLNLIQNLVTSAPPGVPNFRPSGLSVAADGSLYVEDNDNTAGGNDSVLHYTFTNNAGLLTAHFDASHSYVGTGTNTALQFTFGNNIGPDGNLYIAALGGGGNGSFNINSGYVDGIYEFNTTNDAVSRLITGFTEKGGPVGPSSLDAPKYLQFDINFVKARDAGVTPEPGTVALLFSGLAGIGVLRFAKRRSAR